MPALEAGQGERGVAVCLDLGVDVGSHIEEELDGRRVAVHRRQHQRRDTKLGTFNWENWCTCQNLSLVFILLKVYLQFDPSSIGRLVCWYICHNFQQRLHFHAPIEALLWTNKSQICTIWRRKKFGYFW